MVDYSLFIDSTLRVSTYGDSLDVINPALEEPYATGCGGSTGTPDNEPTVDCCLLCGLLIRFFLLEYLVYRP